MGCDLEGAAVNPVTLPGKRAYGHANPATDVSEIRIPEIVTFISINPVSKISVNLLFFTLWNGSCRAMVCTYIAMSAKILEPEIYGPVYFQRKVSGHDSRLEI
jgi:hypothetical protein